MWYNQGALAGGIVGLIVNMWIGIGAYSTPSGSTPLPPTSTAGCFPKANTTIPLVTSTQMYTPIPSPAAIQTQLSVNTFSNILFPCLVIGQAHIFSFTCNRSSADIYTSGFTCSLWKFLWNLYMSVNKVKVSN